MLKTSILHPVLRIALYYVISFLGISVVAMGLGQYALSFNQPPTLVYIADSPKDGDTYLCLCTTDVRTGMTIERVLTSSYYYFSWSPDRTKVVAQSFWGGDNQEISLIDLLSGIIVPLTNYLGRDRNPAWSPTTDQIAFISDRSGSQQLHVMSSLGDNIRQLSEHYPSDHQLDNPVWSPDGLSVAYMGPGGIFGYSFTNQQQTLIYSASSGIDYQTITFSPNSHYLAFARWDTESDTPSLYGVYIVGFEGRDLIRVGEGHQQIRGISWSPDSKALVFAANDGDNYDIYRVNIDGTNLRRLTTHKYDDLYPLWSPDGEYIAFTYSGIYVMRSDGNDIRQVTSSQLTIYNLAWQP